MFAVRRSGAGSTFAKSTGARQFSFFPSACKWPHAAATIADEMRLRPRRVGPSGRMRIAPTSHFGDLMNTSCTERYTPIYGRRV